MKTKKRKKTRTKPKAKTQRWIVHVAGGVEPELYGPYASNAARNKGVLDIEDDRETDAMFKLNISPSGVPSVETWSGGEMEEILGEDAPEDNPEDDAEEDDPDRKARRAAHRAYLNNLSDESYEDLRRHDALGLNDY